MLGKKEKTSTGFRIPGHSGKVIETYFETLLAGTASDMVQHLKKDRVVQVISGNGFVILDDGVNGVIEKRIQAGDELIFKAGVAHRFATTAEQTLELHVSQEAKYEVHMKVVEASTATKEVTSEMLQENHRAQVLSTPPRRGSKARQQQAMKNSTRLPSGQVILPAGVPVTAASAAVAQQGDGVATAADVMNARPSNGRFDEAGAG